jgi:hypothetical protein
MAIDTVLLRDLNVMPPDPGAATQDGGQDDISSCESVAAVKAGLDLCRMVPRGDELLDPLLRPGEAFGIDIHQGDQRVLEQREGEHIAYELTRKT